MRLSRAVRQFQEKRMIQNPCFTPIDLGKFIRQVASQIKLTRQPTFKAANANDLAFTYICQLLKVLIFQN